MAEQVSDVKPSSSKSFLAGLGGGLGLIIGIFVAIILLCCGCSFIAYVSNGSNTGTLQSEGNTSPTTTEKVRQTFKVGDAVELNKLTVTVIQFNSKVSSSNQFMQPTTGMKFVAVEVSVKNQGDEENANLFDFNLKDSSDYKFTPTLLQIKEPSFKSDTLKSGDTLRGWVTFEVPEGSKDFILIYEPSFWSSDSVTVKLF